MHGEEFGDGGVDAAPVVGTDGVVTGVVEGQVLDWLLTFLQCRDELLAFADWYARVTRSVRYQHWRADAIDAMDRRDAREQFGVALCVAVLQLVVAAEP
jgi:hypothetical protein